MNDKLVSFRVVIVALDRSRIQQAAASLASRLAAAPHQIEAMLRSPRYVLARGLERPQAEAYVQILSEEGVEAVIEDEGLLLTVELPAAHQAPGVTASNPDDVVRRLADYKRISGIAWIVLAIVQMLTLYLIIAGIWNLIVGIQKIKLSKKIGRREADVPPLLESVWGLVVVAIINVLFGGIIGVVLVGFDFYIRDKVLSHRSLFDQAPLTEEDAYARKKAKRLARAIEAKGL